MRHVPSFAKASERDKSTDAARVVELAEGEHSLDFLQAVYRDPMQPLSVRMRAAIEVLPFEAPKLSAVAVSSMSGAAERLERAIARSGVNVEDNSMQRLLPCRNRKTQLLIDSSTAGNEYPFVRLGA